jgi:hypothetical protein
MRTTSIFLNLHPTSWARLGFQNLSQITESCFPNPIGPKDLRLQFVDPSALAFEALKWLSTILEFIYRDMTCKVATGDRA